MKINQFQFFLEIFIFEKTKQKNKEKKMSYDEILSSISMQIVDGKIQLHKKITEEEKIQEEEYQPSPEVPFLTREQYIQQMKMLHYQRNVELQRIQQIKSKQMFSSPIKPLSKNRFRLL